MKRTWIHAMAVALGVAALVAVHAFRADAERSVHAEARNLLGADLRFSNRDPLPDTIQAIVDSLVTAGARISTMVSLPSMVLSTTTGTARLFQIRAVEGGWPFYGGAGSDPPGTWPPEPAARGAWVDAAAMIQLGSRLGDTLLIGDVRVPLLGTVVDFPAELGLQTAVGPRVFIPRAVLNDADLLGFGSLVRYQTYLAMEDEGAATEVTDRYRDRLRASGTSSTTARGRAEALSDGLQNLSRYLGVVGLGALLLGGIGVASAIHVFVRSKLTSVAVLRCLGATRGSVLWAYLVQAAGVGIGGSVLGAALGVALQLLLPQLLGGLLPFEIVPRLSWSAVLLGIAVGSWATLAFALGPLLPLRNVPPLLALRNDFEAGPPARDRLTWAVRGGIGVTVVLLSVLEAPTVLQGLAVAAGLSGVLLLLWGLAVITTRSARRLVPRGASYAVRQGVSNLFRPRNQTVPVVMAMGFGVFVIGTVGEVERNLSEGLSLEVDQGAPNVLLFDIQTDQRERVEAVVARHASSAPISTPMVPARIAALNGRPAADLMADTSDTAPSRWALRREYRNTYRDALTDAEELVAGAWWTEGGEPGGDGIPGISVEADLAESLGLDIGSTVTWDLAGRTVETEVRSLRTVDWARFEPNFYVVYEPGVVERAPHTFLTVARVEGEEARGRLQRDVAMEFTNVSVLDLARVQDALAVLLDAMRRAMSFLALFSAMAGVVILAGAVAVTRAQRMREAALLKTLGARRSLVLRIMVVEYAALGALSTGGALILAIVAAWALVTGVLDMSFRLHLGPAIGVAAAVTGLALAAGLVGGRGVLGRPPLRVLRELSE